MANLENSTDCPAGYACGVGTDRSMMFSHQCPAGYYCGPETHPMDQYEKMCERGYYCLRGTPEYLALRNKCNSGFFCPAGTASAQEVEIRCPRLTETANGASELIECNILDVDVCDKTARSSSNPYEDASYYSYHVYRGLDDNAAELTVFDSKSATAATGEVMVVSKVIPVNETSSANFWINDTVEVFRTCPEYSDEVGWSADDPQPGITIIGRNFRDSPLLSCRWTPCLGSDEWSVPPTEVLGLERRCRDTNNGEFFRNAHDGSYTDSSSSFVGRAEFISENRVLCRHPGYRFFDDAFLGPGQNTSACFYDDDPSSPTYQEVGFLSSCGQLTGKKCSGKPYPGYQLVFDLIVACDQREVEGGTCPNQPDPSQSTKFNPCYTGQVKVDVTNDGSKYSGDGLVVNHSSVVEVVSGFADYYVPPSWAVFTYVMSNKFINHEKAYTMDRLRCNRTKHSEEGARERERGWYGLKSMEIAQLSMDLEHIPTKMRYPDDWRIAVYITPSRCTDERCNENRVRIAAKETVPCRQPVDLTPWFLDRSVSKHQVLNFTVFALDDVLMKTEVHIVHGLYMPLAPFFVNTTTILIKKPSRANMTKGPVYRENDMDSFETVVGRRLPNGAGRTNWEYRKLSPYISYEERIVQHQYFFGIRYEQGYSDDIFPPYNMPPLYEDYAKGRVLMSFNTSAEAEHIPTILDKDTFVNDDGSRNPFTSGATANDWWDQKNPSYSKTKELIDTYFETFHGYIMDPTFITDESGDSQGKFDRMKLNQTIHEIDIAPTSTTMFDTLLLTYLPFFSNCREFDSFIPFHHLVEDSSCSLPDPDDDGYERFPVPEGTFFESYPERLEYPPYPHDDDIKVVGPWQIYEVPIADWCERSLTCAYEEDLNQQQIVPRWMEASSGDVLFYFLRLPIRYDEYVGRYVVPSATGKEYERTSSARTHPMDVGGGAVVANKQDEGGDDFFIPLQVDRDAAGDAPEQYCTSSSTGCFPHALTLDVSFYQQTPNMKRIVSAELVFEEFSTDTTEIVYTLDVSFYARDFHQLLLAFAFDADVFVALFVLIGLISMIVATALYWTMRALTLLERPPELRLYGMAVLILPPGLAGFLAGIVPISLAMLFFHILLKGYDSVFLPTISFGVLGMLPTYSDYTWTLIDSTKLHYMDPSYDASQLENARFGRIGLAFCTLATMCIVIGAQIFLPNRNSKREKEIELKREKDAAKEDVWIPNTWKRSNLIFVSYMAAAYGIVCVEFSFWQEFGDYIWFVIIGTTLLGVPVGNMIDGQLKETLLGNPVNTALGTAQGLGTLAADDFMDFLLGYFVDFGMMMMMRIYIDPKLGDFIDAFGEIFGMIMSKIYSFLPKALVGRSQKKKAVDEEEEEEGLAKGEKREIEGIIAENADTVEPLLDSFGSYSCDMIAYQYTPFSTFLLILYRNECGLPALYGIKEQDMLYYVIFQIMIIPFQVVCDVFIHSCNELYHGWKIYDYLVYTRYRFLQRECRWKGLEDSLDECIDESLRTLDQMCFSSQYYMMMTIHVNGIFMFVFGVEIMLRAQYNFLGDQAALTVIPFVIWSSVFIRKFCLWLAIYFKLWRIKHENTAWHSAIPEEDEFDIPGWEDINGASHDAFIMNQRITQETFRFKFLNYNRTWLINQLPSILTPRTLRRSRPYLINQFTRILNSLNQDISSDDDEDGGDQFGPVALTAPSRQMVRWWLAQARRRMRLREVVQPLINKARGTQCEQCLSRKQLSVEIVIPLEVLAEKFDEEHPDEEFDQVAWKTFWIRHQRYRTVCLACVSARKEKERNAAMKDAGLFAETDDEGDAEYPEWGPVYLSAASRAMLINWYRQAQESLFGKGGRRRKQVMIDVSDDEGDEIPSQWANTNIDLSAASHALAIRWLRTARSNIQKARGLGGEGDPSKKLVQRRRKPGGKQEGGKKSKNRKK
jgi:hypothetical protein